MTAIAIVGGSYHNWREFSNAKMLVQNACRSILKQKPTLFISGGCGGVDRWAEEIAKDMGIECKIFKPESRSWFDKNGKKGYESRNKEIAEACDELYCIETVGRKHSGGLWTHDYAKKLGKKTKVVLVG